MEFVLLVVVIVGMVIACYFTSGISNTAGSIFEKKSVVGERTSKK